MTTTEPRTIKTKRYYEMDNRTFVPAWLVAIERGVSREVVIAEIAAGVVKGERVGSQWFIEVEKEGEKP